MKKNGDALCDTSADPDLSSPTALGGKVENCLYSIDDEEMDSWGDIYTTNNVEPRNIMSYTNSECADYFSQGQINVMWRHIMFSYVRTNNIFDKNEDFMNPDQYEPDNSDFLDVARIIKVGETQCHSFHGFKECTDKADWLRIDNSNGEIGSYVIEINSVEGFVTAIKEVNIFNTDANGNRASKYSTIIGESGSIQIPCNTSNNDFLIEVVKADDPGNEIVKGIYSISLSAPAEVMLSHPEKKDLCNGDKYEILNLPANATVNWASSNGTSIQVNNDQSVFVYGSNGLTEYWIRAVVNSNGCRKVIEKTFESANGNSLQAFEIVEIFPACYPPESTFDYGIYKTVPSIDANWSVSSGTIFESSIRNGVSVNPGFGSFTLTATVVTECGNDYAVSKTFFADECDDCPFGLNVTNNDNKTINVEVVNQSQNFRSSAIHQVVVTNSNYEITDEMVTTNSVATINTNDYGDGIYYINVYTDDDCFEVKKVFVNNIDNCTANCTCAANISDAQLSNKTFKVAQKIISDSFNNADVTYIAGESILLETGFEAHRYFDFVAKIEDCQ